MIMMIIMRKRRMTAMVIPDISGLPVNSEAGSVTTEIPSLIFAGPYKRSPSEPPSPVDIAIVASVRGLSIATAACLQSPSVM